ncbi:helix-turn-helix domain-containing protein [Inquilinus sp. NPDC058860]|uniref:helix-turn-helix domain-containing protein n=1 Tax=Inquilinus sp. NPDC058860 TaxID=3346652 RepID=UPI00369369FE
MSKFGRELIESAREALAIAEGHAEAARTIALADVDVSAIRKRLGLSQSAFATKFGFSVSAVRDWEQHRKVPEPATRAFLKVIEKEPEAVERALSAA